MLRELLGSALAGSLIASSALAADASPRLSGRAELLATHLHLSDDDAVIQGGEAENLWILGGGGSLDAASDALHVQLDFSGESSVDHGSADDTYQGSFGGGLHAGWRDPARGSIGVFGGVGNLEINDRDGNDPTTVAWALGVEGQKYFDAATLYLQAGYLDREAISSGGDVAALKNAGLLRGIGRYFWNDDLELEAGLSYLQGKMDSDEDNVWSVGWEARVEARLGDTPVAGFVGYRGALYHQDDDNDTLTEHRIAFGVRIYFGQQSLEANDRHGASLDLPRQLEWNGVIAGPLE